MSAPKPPTPKKVNIYEGMTSDPEFAKAAKELGYTSVNKDYEVAAVKELMLKNTAELERKDKSFRKAERQLYKEGLLETNDPFTDKKSWKDHYIQKNNLKGKKGQKAANQAYKAEVAERGKNFIYADDTDTEFELQKIYDRMATNEANKENRQFQKGLDKQIKAIEKGQKKQAKQQQKLMEEMMNQPVYSARQADVMPVQYKAKAPEPMPAAPAPPPAMNINPTPPPEMTNIGSQMSIIRQSSTASQRSRRRTRGTSTLRT